MMETNPPLLNHYEALLRRPAAETPTALECGSGGHERRSREETEMEECELPVIDLSSLLKSENEKEMEACAGAICRASSEWGFFQVVKHGISVELLGKMRKEQVKLFEMPFERKASCGLLNNSYRWGSPRATCPSQFSWSEAFHIPLQMISEASCYGEFSVLREVMKEVAEEMSKLARVVGRVLAENLGHRKGAFEEKCNESTCFLRLNHYPPCPKSEDKISGFVAHTDSDFLTILCQDQVGGLQLMKDSKWVAVKPNPRALIVNIGDLFQAWSNDVYKSVEHKVVANENSERYSMAYFLCPSYDSLIGSCKEPSVYRKFTFGEYRSRVQEDVKNTGHKVGLPRFLL